jgi:hypothetical protein
MINDETTDREVADEKGACETGCSAETCATTKKSVVSKRTKLLFIAFGAVSIACIAIVWGPDFDKNFAKAQAPAKTTSAAPAPAKAAR